MTHRSLDGPIQAQRVRLAFIESSLWYPVDARCSDLIDRFGIAPAVAPREQAAYREKHRKKSSSMAGARSMCPVQPSRKPLPPIQAAH